MCSGGCSLVWAATVGGGSGGGGGGGGRVFISESRAKRFDVNPVMVVEIGCSLILVASGCFFEAVKFCTGSSVTCGSKVMSLPSCVHDPDPSTETKVSSFTIPVLRH